MCYSEGGDALAQAAHGPTWNGDNQWMGQPDAVDDNPVHSRGVGNR